MNIKFPGLDQSTLPFSFDKLQRLVDMLLLAGKTALDMRAEVDINTKSGPEDLVTCADKKLSEILMAGIAVEFPEDHIISEEHPFEESNSRSKRRWFIDPIDGTKHYVNETGRWSVMAGLVQDDNSPVFGIFYIPAFNILYLGGPSMGSWRYQPGAEEAERFLVPALVNDKKVRTLISKNDLAKNTWAKSVPGIEIETASSIGLDVHEVLSQSVETFVHIRPTLKTWDTAAPAAVALGAGLEVGSEVGPGLDYPHDHASHENHVLVGRKGSLSWWQRGFQKSFGLAGPESKPSQSLAGCC